MVTFRDGPAAAAVLELRRAPNWLRVVVHDSGRIDALDQLDDSPSPDETVHVYELVEGTRSVIFACGRGRFRGGGRYAVGEYRHLPDVDGEALRETDAWRQWTADRAGVPLQVVLDSIEQERRGG